MKIEIDMRLLAEEIISECSYYITEYDIISQRSDSYIEDVIIKFISGITPIGYLISANAIATIIEELKPFIIQCILTKLNNQVAKFETEDLELLTTPIRNYEVEKDE